MPTLPRKQKHLLQLTGVMTVRSGRWLPPAAGWLFRITSPSYKLSPRRSICTNQKYNFRGSSKRADLQSGYRMRKSFLRSSPGTWQSLAGLPDGLGCAVHWPPGHHRDQREHKKSPAAPGEGQMKELPPVKICPNQMCTVEQAKL